MKTRTALQREHAKLDRMMHGRASRNESEIAMIYGARQALAWALGMDAMSAARAFGYYKKPEVETKR